MHDKVSLRHIDIPNTKLFHGISGRKLADIEIEEVPPYIWQLLLISRKVGYLLVDGRVMRAWD